MRSWFQSLHLNVTCTNYTKAEERLATNADTLAASHALHADVRAALADAEGARAAAVASSERCKEDLRRAEAVAAEARDSLSSHRSDQQSGQAKVGALYKLNQWCLRS